MKPLRLLIFLLVIFLYSCNNISRKNPLNQLNKSTSPYLLQHADNPVNWLQWGEESFAKARKENKPVLVSIGYSSCHWCHVMAKECFENDSIAKIMNENFICIKVDREERPDIDKIYLDAVESMGISGGWPLNVFVTADKKPFFGGTYFPPQNWITLLQQVSKTYREDPKSIESSANDIINILKKINESNSLADTGNISPQLISFVTSSIATQFDAQFGGLKKTPKFINPVTWQFMLRSYAANKKTETLSNVTYTLNQIAKGGLYDIVGGGFSRYSTDEKWQVPHFEKMLYDNAQLISLYAEAYAVTKKSAYKKVIYQTISWLKEQMTGASNEFYSAIDADSEGEEGKFYIWAKNEIDSALGKDAPLFNEYFSLSNEGNWEKGKNILHSSKNDSLFAAQHSITQNALLSLIEKCTAILHNVRKKRRIPNIDKKAIASWNALTVCGLLDAYNYLGDENFLTLALNNIHFIETKMIDDGKLYRSYNKTHSETEAFLEDYSFLIKAYLKCYESTFNEEWLTKAMHWSNYVIAGFSNANEILFTSSSTTAEQILQSNKEVFDNVMPSPNAVMANNLFQLGILLDNTAYRTRAKLMLGSMQKTIKEQPLYTTCWASLQTAFIHDMAEVAITGSEFLNFRKTVAGNFLPFALLAGINKESSLPMLKDKPLQSTKTIIYVCYNKICKKPVDNTMDALKQLK